MVWIIRIGDIGSSAMPSSVPRDIFISTDFIYARVFSLIAEDESFRFLADGSLSFLWFNDDLLYLDNGPVCPGFNSAVTPFLNVRFDVEDFLEVVYVSGLDIVIDLAI